MIKYLKEKCNQKNIEITDNQLHKFSVYYNHLMKVNQSMNLTTITDEKEVVLKHFLDSIMIINSLDFSGCRVIDVGTGAGFPGIPLAIMCTDANFVLLDSLQKRLHFIEEVLELCQISNVQLIHGRAEDYGKNLIYREQFDYCLSRAVASLPVLLEFCIPFVKVGGKFISYKSELLTDELETAKHALEVLQCKYVDNVSYDLPDIDVCRYYAFFEKTDILPSKYPRQAGKPKKKPL